MPKDLLAHFRFATAEKMKEIPDGKAQLTLLSPPYIPHHNKRGKMTDMNLLLHLLAETARVTSAGGVVATYNTDLRDQGRIYSRHNIIRDLAEASGLELIGEKIRVRTTKTDLYRLGFSFIQIFRKMNSTVSRNRNLPEYRRDVWVLPHHQRCLEFRDAIPPEVPAILIKNFTDPGDLVVSSCAGSGTIVIAALRLGRKAIGYEIDPGRKPVIRERAKKFDSYFSDPQIAQWLNPPA